MDVYLVPVPGERHELYCEPVDEPAAPVAVGSHGLWRRLLRKFSEALAAAEHEHEHGDHGERNGEPAAAVVQSGWGARLRARVMCRIAEAIAEQRLLWRLRGQTRVRALYAAGTDEHGAMALIRRSLGADADRHRRWLLVDLVGLLFSLLLVPVPGPNLPGYYFTFRVVGHFLAMRGAGHGLARVEWVLEASPLLAELGEAGRLPPQERVHRVRAIAAALGLPRLPKFFERTAPGGRVIYSSPP